MKHKNALKFNIVSEKHDLLERMNLMSNAKSLTPYKLLYSLNVKA